MQNPLSLFWENHKGFLACRWQRPEFDMEPAKPLLSLIPLRWKQSVQHWNFASHKETSMYRSGCYLLRLFETVLVFTAANLTCANTVSDLIVWDEEEQLFLQALLRGRWSTAAVAKKYIQDGLSRIPMMTYTPKARDMLKTWNPFNTFSVETGGRGTK